MYYLRLNIPFNFIGLCVGVGVCYFYMKYKYITMSEDVMKAIENLDQRIKEINQSRLKNNLSELKYEKSNSLVDIEHIKQLRLRFDVKDVIYCEIDTNLYAVAYATRY